MKRRAKDLTRCPKCFKIYCEGFWSEGVCTSDMYFGSEPTSAGDAMASYLRVWYEANRESFWDRRRKRWRYSSDNFMIRLINEVGRIEQARLTEEIERERLEHDERKMNDL